MEKAKESALKPDQRLDGSCCGKAAGKDQEKEMAEMKEELQKLRGDHARDGRDMKKKSRSRSWRGRRKGCLHFGLGLSTEFVCRACLHDLGMQTKFVYVLKVCLRHSAKLSAAEMQTKFVYN